MASTSLQAPPWSASGARFDTSDLGRMLKRPPQLTEKPKQKVLRRTSTSECIRPKTQSLLRKPDLGADERTTTEYHDFLLRKKIDILLKNPCIFRTFQDRCRDSQIMSPIGVRLTLAEFLPQMKLVELLEELQTDPIAEQQPRKQTGIFARLGYISSPRKKPSKEQSPKTKKSKLRIWSRSPRLADNDERSALSAAESLELSLPSLEHTEDDSNDSVASSLIGWTIRQESSCSLNSRQNSLRSLNSRQNSLRSISRESSLRSINFRENSLRCVTQEE